MKIFTTLTFFSLLFASTSFSQAINQVKLASNNVATVQKNIDNGVLTFYFNTKIDAKKVISNAKYYTEYFSVKYDKTSGKTILNYVDESKMARKVTVRFLSSNNIKEVLLGDQIISIDEFMTKYLK